MTLLPFIVETYFIAKGIIFLHQERNAFLNTNEELITTYTPALAE